MSQSITISWHPTIEDAYRALRLEFWGTPGRVIRSSILLFVLPGIAFACLYNLVMGVQLSQEQMAMAVVGFGFTWGVLFGLAFGKWLAHHMVKSLRAKGDPQQITVTDEGVERALRDTSVRHSWAAISRIEETPWVFMLFGTSGLITGIEKSGITSEAELQALRSFLRDKKPGKYLG